VSGLFDGSLCFGGEESAGASFLRRDGTVWSTDKDGPIMDLLAPGENVPTAPFAALSAVSGRSFVVYAPLSAGVKVSSRP